MPKNRRTKINSKTQFDKSTQTDSSAVEASPCDNVNPVIALPLENSRRHFKALIYTSLVLLFGVIYITNKVLTKFASRGLNKTLKPGPKYLTYNDLNMAGEKILASEYMEKHDAPLFKAKNSF